MHSKIAFTFLFLFTVTVAFAQKKELQSITENELKAHLEFISSDYMQGRDFNTPIPGLELTAQYLKSECLSMGLKPVVKNFTQPFRLFVVKTDSSNTFIKLKTQEGTEKFRSNDIITFAGSAKKEIIDAPIIFAGYGYKNTEYNDFEGFDLKDKIVMIMTRNIEISTDTSKRNDNTNLEMTKLASIYMAGAKAVILTVDPLNQDNSWFEMVKEYASQGTYLLDTTEHMELLGKIILVQQETANAILKETGMTLEEIQHKINESGKPNSFEIKNVTAEIQIAKISGIVNGENIVAFIEGSDPILKNECVVLTAHYDHVGISLNGEINNGADDNGSGTVTLLEVADAFSKMKKKPRRSIVFAWVTAEEKGLFGSEFYTLNPVFPLLNTVANINLDMVGRSANSELETVNDPDNSLAGPNGIYFITGNQSSDLTEIGNKISKELSLIPSDALSKEFMNSSDQYNFYKNGIPVLGITTGLHEDYHHPSDDEGKIDYHKMKRIGDFTFLVAYEIANRKKRIVVDNPVKK